MKPLVINGSTKKENAKREDADGKAPKSRDGAPLPWESKDTIEKYGDFMKRVPPAARQYYVDIKRLELFVLPSFLFSSDPFFPS